MSSVATILLGQGPLRRAPLLMERRASVCRSIFAVGVGFLAVGVGLLALAATATAAPAVPIWSVESQSLPTVLHSSDTKSFVQDVSVKATSGSFTLSFEGDTTRPLGGSSSGEVESALDELGTIGGVGAKVSAEVKQVQTSQLEQETLGENTSYVEYIVTFEGTLKGAEVPLMSADGSALTGGAHNVIVGPSTNDEYLVDLENIGSQSSSGPVTMVDHLPAGVKTTQNPRDEAGLSSQEWTCSEGAGQTVVTCTLEREVTPAATAYDEAETVSGPADIHPLVIPVTVERGVPTTVGNTVTVTGGGAAATASATNSSSANEPEEPTFGSSLLSVQTVGASGEVYTQAAGHPWALTTDVSFNKELNPVLPGLTNAPLVISSGAPNYTNAVGGEEPRTVVAELPLGLIGDPQATPQCSQAKFVEDAANNRDACPADTRVGIAYIGIPGRSGPFQIFNLQPEPGHAAEFGFIDLGVPIVLYGDLVRGTRGYVLRITALTLQVSLVEISLTFFGDPAAAFATGERERAFLTNPAECEATEAPRELQLHVDTWNAPGRGDPLEADFSDPSWVPASTLMAPVSGCGALTFKPSVTLAPSPGYEGGSAAADEPSGYTVKLGVPQTEVAGALGTPPLKTATVAFPAGLSVSAAAAGGLQACSSGQIDLQANVPGNCPLASQLGTAKLTTPLLASPVEGSLFLGEPECSPCSNSDASDGRLFPLYIELRSSALGVDVKLPGVVRANPATGQLTAEFAENPQVPFSSLEIKLKGGPRAPLANPQTCGTFQTSSALEPWSAPDTPDATSLSSFAISGCSAGFAPSLAAGTTPATAGSYSSFSLAFARNDGEQNLGAISVRTPAGLLANVAGVPRCAEAEANAGTCPSASQIGTTIVSAGSGADPYTITDGRVYLTGPYHGAPFGLSIVVPTVAGPFNLGDVVVRAAIAIDPATAQLTITSDPLPQIVDGVPIRLRAVDVEIDRPGFMLNATNCDAQALTATFTGEHPLGGSEAPQTSTSSSAYAASGCASLPFKPKLTASTQGKASKAGGASLDVKIESAGLGQANIAKVDLQLPTALPSRLSTLQKACLAAVFNANPAACEEDSVIGKATIHTPILNAPLTGPAYLVSHGGAAFPDVEFVLQGEGVTLILDGKTDIKNGITYSRFESTPDAPFTTFETELPTGPHSILGAYVKKTPYDLCGTNLQMPTTITGQNGAVIEQTTKVLVTGCKAAKPLTRAQKLTAAIKRCKQDKKKKRRATCEARARKMYGPMRKKILAHGKGSK